jgi:pimeloyl-ACP methyl ester carboxylesterase
MLILPEISPVDGPLHQQNMTLLNALNTAPDVATLRTLLGGLIEAADVLTLLPSAGSTTKTFVLTNTPRAQLVIVCGGMDSTFVQANSCLQSWEATVLSPPAYNTFLVAAAGIASGVPLLGGGYSNVRLIGHSYGGAVAMMLPNRLGPIISNAYSSAFQIYTYGAPKPTNDLNLVANTGFQVRRVFQNTDPVPSLPLSSKDVGSLWMYVGVPLARSWNRWTQGVSGLYFSGGTLLQASNPNTAATPTLLYLSLLRWLTSINAFGADVHSLASYTQAVTYVEPAPTFTPAPATVRIRRLPDATVQELTIQRDEQIAVVAVNNSANPQAAANGVQSGIVLKPGVRYRGIKVQGVPWVFYGDQPVIPTRTLRTRRALVRYLNRTL